MCGESETGAKCVYETVAYVSNIKIVLGAFPRLVKISPSFSISVTEGSDNRRKSGETPQIRINGDKVYTGNIKCHTNLISFWGSQVMGYKCEARCTPCEHW